MFGFHEITTFYISLFPGGLWAASYCGQKKSLKSATSLNRWQMFTYSSIHICRKGNLYEAIMKVRRSPPNHCTKLLRDWYAEYCSPKEACISSPSLFAAVRIRCDASRTIICEYQSEKWRRNLPASGYLGRCMSEVPEVRSQKMEVKGRSEVTIRN